MSHAPTEHRATGGRSPDDWVTVFLRVILSLFVGLPLGGLLFALWSVVLAVYTADPITQTPWSLALRTVLAWISFIVFGGFAWTPEDGYHSLHGWYAAGVVLAFVLTMRPWSRTVRGKSRG